jgi:WD40 repeat protein
MLSIPGNFSVQFSSDDRLLGPEHSGNKVRLWRLAQGRELRVLRPRSAGSLDNIHSPVLHADGRILAASANHQLCFFDLASGEELASVRLQLADTARPAFFDPPQPSQSRPEPKSGLSGERAGSWVTGGYNGAYLWSVRQDPAWPGVMRIGPPQQLAPNPGGSYSVGASASADGRVVAVPQGNSTLVLYRDRPDKRLLLGPLYDVRNSAVSPDGLLVVTCSWGADGSSKTVRIWDADTGLPVQDLTHEPYTSAKFSPDGRWLMTTDSSGTRQWEVGTWRAVRRFDRSGFAFSPDKRLLAINDVFGVIRLLEISTGREVARLTGPEPTSYAPACFSPDGTRLVAIDSGETALYVWDLRLIRQQLKELGLDWVDWPEFAAGDPRAKTAKQTKVEILAGDLAEAESTAWALVTNPDPSMRDLKRALELALQAVNVAPQSMLAWQFLGWIQYRTGNWIASLEALEKSCALQEDGGDGGQWIVMALAHGKLANEVKLLDHERAPHKSEARRLYDQAVKQIEGHPGLKDEIGQAIQAFRAEAAELFGAKAKPE